MLPISSLKIRQCDFYGNACGNVTNRCKQQRVSWCCVECGENVAEASVSPVAMLPTSPNINNVSETFQNSHKKCKIPKEKIFGFPWTKSSVMSSTSSEEECICKGDCRDSYKEIHNFLWVNDKLRGRRKRRRRCSNERDQGEFYKFLRRFRSKKFKINEDASFYFPGEQNLFYNCLQPKLSSSTVFLGSKSDNGTSRSELSLKLKPEKEKIVHSANDHEKKNGNGINRLPEEILLLIFSYLPLAMLLLVIPHVCKKWEKIATDWTLWKSVEHLGIKSMVVTTKEVKTLLRTIPKLKKLELVLRNDTEELLEELFKASEHLEVLRLDRCSSTGLHLNIPPNTVKAILDSCPRLKSVTLSNTYFRSKDFYKCLAQKFRTFERINISCTTKSEMNFFVYNLKKHVSGVEFQNVSMMGKADGKQIYWGPILGLVIRPNPTSPYHKQHTANEFPNYAF